MLQATGQVLQASIDPAMGAGNGQEAATGARLCGGAVLDGLLKLTFILCAMWSLEECPLYLGDPLITLTARFDHYHRICVGFMFFAVTIQSS